ncbi:MAG: peptidylprolyl isomerase [Candidatus Eisenbacteria bacterium]|nr:peptidylprolyl isomerase [Candidatus Eisenbacteria bacterium]
MAKVESGDKVKVHYTGKLEDGTVFDTSRDGDPAEFTVGENEVIEGLEEAVVGMQPGETKTAHVKPEQAFGEWNSGRVVEIDRINLPEGLDPEIGQILRSRDPSGETRLVKVVDVEQDKVKLDANHPLAGKELTIELELVGIA